MRSVTSGDTDAHRDLMYRELVLHADGMEDAVNDVRARRTRAEASYLRNLTRAVAGGNLVAFMAKGPAREEAKQRAQDAYDRFVVDGEEAALASPPPSKKIKLECADPATGNGQCVVKRERGITTTQ